MIDLTGIDESEDKAVEITIDLTGIDESDDNACEISDISAIKLRNPSEEILSAAPTYFPTDQNVEMQVDSEDLAKNTTATLSLPPTEENKIERGHSEGRVCNKKFPFGGLICKESFRIGLLYLRVDKPPKIILRNSQME